MADRVRGRKVDLIDEQGGNLLHRLRTHKDWNNTKQPDWWRAPNSLSPSLHLSVLDAFASQINRSSRSCTRIRILPWSTARPEKPKDYDTRLVRSALWLIKAIRQSSIRASKQASRSLNQYKRARQFKQASQSISQSINQYKRAKQSTAQRPTPNHRIPSPVS